jgi:hypothetical protein
MADRADKIDEYVVLVAEVTKYRVIGTGQAWDYGWCQSEYRSSDDASISYENGMVVRLGVTGVSLFENFVGKLLKDSRVRAAWSDDELWGVAAQLIATLPYETDCTAEARARLHHLISPKETLTIHALANVAWTGEPMAIGGAVIGRYGGDWLTLVQKQSQRAIEIPKHLESRWEADIPSDQASVVFADFSNAYGLKADALCTRKIENLLALALLMRTPVELAALELYSLRGDAYRPGIRGLQLDRQSLDKAVKHFPPLSQELAAEVFQSSRIHTGCSHRWYSACPFPLDKLLGVEEARHRVAKVILEDRAIPRRVRTGARWYAQAHWSSSDVDAILSLGVALDCMLGDASGLPGRVLTERFAFLESNKARRAEKAKRFGKLYEARSSIAHGGKMSGINGDFVRGMASEVQWVASRLLEWDEHRSIPGDKQFAELFESIKWGLED